MSSHYAQLRDGNRTAIPDAYLPADYVPGSMRVEAVPVKGPGGESPAKCVPAIPWPAEKTKGIADIG
jgi:hypothetical protein